MCVADYLSPNRKILSATCEVAIKLHNIAFQQVFSIAKIGIAHAFGKLITASFQILNECDMMASLKVDPIQIFSKRDTAGWRCNSKESEPI